MKKSQNSSNAQIGSDHGRRDFLSLSLLASSTFLLSAERQAHAQSNQNNDVAILSEVSAADSLALYGNLLDEVRRLVLQKDATMIYVAKWEATSWLDRSTADAKRLRANLVEGAAITPEQQAELRRFLSEVAAGGKEISEGLIRMRQQPLEEIRRLDTDFDVIRAELTAASNAIKQRNPGIAKEGIASAIGKLDKYRTSVTYTFDRSATNSPPTQTKLEKEYQSSLITAQRLQELLRTVYDLLGANPATPHGDLHHPTAYSRTNYSSSIMTAPAQRSGITAVLRSKLNPSSYLQVAIGYAVTFPILMRVSDKNNRIKLLNDALRLVPPGLRNPLLAELASDLANVP